MDNNGLHINIDVTNSMNCAVAKEEFRLIDFSSVAGAQFVDIVHTKAPYLHFQVLSPVNEEQRTRALNYFHDNHKIVVTFSDRIDMLLYVGCTNNIYIKSGVAEVDENELRNLIPQVAHWYKFYGNNK